MLNVLNDNNFTVSLYAQRKTQDEVQIQQEAFLSDCPVHSSIERT